MSLPDKIAAPETILAFWREAGYDKWFTRDDAFDAAIRDKFMPTYEAAAAGKLSSWEATAEGALAHALPAVGENLRDHINAPCLVCKHLILGDKGVA